MRSSLFLLAFALFAGCGSCSGSKYNGVRGVEEGLSVSVTSEYSAMDYLTDDPVLLQPGMRATVVLDHEAMREHELDEFGDLAVMVTTSEGDTLARSALVHFNEFRDWWRTTAQHDIEEQRRRAVESAIGDESTDRTERQNAVREAIEAQR